MTTTRRRCPKCWVMFGMDILAGHARNCNGERQAPKRLEPMDICPDCRVNMKLRRVPCCWQCEIKDPEFDWAGLDRAAKTGARE